MSKIQPSLSVQLAQIAKLVDNGYVVYFPLEISLTEFKARLQETIDE